MTLRRWMWIFVAIAVGCFLLAAAGQWWLHWDQDGVMTWLGIGSGYLLAAGLFTLVPRWWREHCDESLKEPANRRYQRAMWPIMVGYALSLFASIWLIKQGIASLPLRGVVAVAPAIPIVLLLRAALRYLREIDELQRRIETEAIGIASLLLSVIYFAGGLLVAAKVIRVDAGMVMIWVFPLLCLLYGIAKMFLTRRYL